MDYTASTLSGAANSGLFMQDSHNYYIGRLIAKQDVDGKANLILTVRHKYNNTNYENALTLSVRADGTQEVAVTSGAEEAWRNAIGLGDSGWIAATPLQTGGVDRYSGTIYYRKIWRTVEIVAVDIQLTNNLVQSDNINLCSIPSGYRPTYRTFGSGGFRANLATTSYHPVTVSVGTSVGVSAIPEEISNSRYLTIHVIYMI